MPSELFPYLAFGVEFESEIELLGVSQGLGAPRVRITRGTVGDHVDGDFERGVLYQASADMFLLNVPRTAKFAVVRGEEIQVEPSKTTSAELIRHLLFGAPLCALLHQLGVLVLHASAILSPKGAVLFCGCSASGKSTLASALYQRGYPLLGDETAAVTFSSEKALLQPAVPIAALWPDSLAKLNVPRSEISRIRPQVNKFAVPLPKGFDPGAVPIHSIYLLGKSLDSVSIEPLHGFKKVQALREHLARPRLIPPGREPEILKQVLNLALSARVSEVRRPRRKFDLAAFVDAIEGDLDP